MHRVLALIVATSLGFVPAESQGAAPPPYIPASLYPSGARFSFSPDYSDSAMNAAWNFDAAGEPFMHTYPQGVFMRQSGWMQEAVVGHGRHFAWFALFDSTYGVFDDGHHGNVEAFRDLRLMLHKWWHARPARTQPSAIVPAGVAGVAETRIIPKLGDGPYLVTSAWWGNSSEIEAIAYTSPHFLDWMATRHMLAAQVRYAVGLASPSTAHSMRLVSIAP